MDAIEATGPRAERASAARVLIADDDPVALRLLRLLLGHEGYQLEFVETGEAVLNAARELRPDLLLLDVNLPDMDLSLIHISEPTRPY